ncbi:hypothetical protein BCL79_0016, partial [Stenotrophomonas rhizophila]
GIGNGVAEAALGTGIAGNSVEHNWLSQGEWEQYEKAKKNCSPAGGDSCATMERLEALSKQRDTERADYINAAREALIASGYEITPKVMAAVDARYWEKQGVDFYDARFLGKNVQATYKGVIWQLRDAISENAETMNGIIPGSGTNAAVIASIMDSLGQSVGGWTGTNPANGKEVVGVEAWDARFLTVVDIATAMIGGGTASARAVGKPLIAETAEVLVEQAARTAVRDSAAPAARSMEQLLPNGKVPGTRGGEFNKWFDNLSSEELNLLWQNKEVRTSIETRIRYPGQLHEWCMVCRAPEFKEWGVSMDEIQRFRTKTSELDWVNPYTGVKGGHGRDSSTTFHNELKAVIDGSKSLEDFNRGVMLLRDKWKIEPHLLPELPTSGVRR